MHPAIALNFLTFPRAALKEKADIKSLIYIVITTALFVSQWIWFGVNPFIYTWFLFMSVAVAVITHNHNHLPMWRSKAMDVLTDWWLTVFYGFPIFAWIPTHNKSHHKFNNREGDDSITYRVSEKNNFLTLVSYPTISGYYRQKAIANYMKDMKANNKEKFWISISQYAVLVLWIAAALIIDWEKALGKRITFGDLRFHSTQTTWRNLFRNGGMPFSLTAVLDENGNLTSYEYSPPRREVFIQRVE